MDMGDPTRSVTSALDGPVLAVLAQATEALTIGDLARAVPRGSEIGVRKCVKRLVVQGLVRARPMGRTKIYELNRDHVAAPAALRLVNLRAELWRRMSKELRTWEVAPLLACVFGPAARGESHPDNAIDLLLVQPHEPRDEVPPLAVPALTQAGTTRSLESTALSNDEPGTASLWMAQVERLRGSVLTWAGNPLVVFDVTPSSWALHRRDAELMEELHRDGVVLMGELPLFESELLGTLTT